VSEIARPAPDDCHASDAGERLQRTIDILCEDAACVELWACALSGFAQPIPDYGFGKGNAGESEPKDG